ncbi:MAG: hypothetical protein ACRCUY_11545 [Thermoguttaceae bacterium]
MISRLAHGCEQLGGHGWGTYNETDAVNAVRYAVEAGINFF